MYAGTEICGQCQVWNNGIKAMLFFLLWLFMFYLEALAFMHVHRCDESDVIILDLEKNPEKVTSDADDSPR